jgi:hypothetical protein
VSQDRDHAFLLKLTFVVLVVVDVDFFGVAVFFAVVDLLVVVFFTVGFLAIVLGSLGFLAAGLASLTLPLIPKIMRPRSYEHINSKTENPWGFRSNAKKKDN